MARPSVVVLDYGSGNLRSAQRALARAGADVTVSADLAAAAAADGLVVPGVGAYAACMAGIDALGAGPMIATRVAGGAPVLGICVGMQILFEYGEESGPVARPGPGSVSGYGPGQGGAGAQTKGLGLLPGGVTRLAADRVPHMGWNTVAAPVDSRIFAGLPPDAWFYFVHSYAAPAGGAIRSSGMIVATTVHGAAFVSAVESGSLAATQFHPEKSADAGAALLRNWVGAL